MRVVVAFPTINLDRARLAALRWRSRGYEVFVLVEAEFAEDVGADLVLRVDQYPGYWQACNHLAKRAVADGADVVVCIGDDMDPDPDKPAGQLGGEYLARFPDGFGIMQPIGDDMDGTDRICGSPWMGRGWVARAYLGAGPYWGEYGHYFGDTELQIVAQRLGVLWQRPDVTQYHHHWARGNPVLPYHRANHERWWVHDAAIFAHRQAHGFPLSEGL